MKIILFSGGEPGVVKTLPEDNAWSELEELLGGPATAEKIDNRGLCLVTRADGEKEGLPCRYILRKFGRGPELILGDCAVVRMAQDLRLLSVRAQDGETAREIIGVVRA